MHLQKRRFPGGGYSVSYVGYICTCHGIGYGFWGSRSLNRVSFLTLLLLCSWCGPLTGGFAKSRPAAHHGPAARGLRWPGGPEAQSWFSTVFCPAVNPCTCTGLHQVWACKMDNGEFEFVYHYYNIKQSFRSFHSLHVTTWKMFSFSVYLSVYKTQVHSQRCKIFSNHSLRLKIS